ncbi:uncharacterized protein FMAN_14119 [Fusarium mangiferae]|uniref:PD-(D/E)XK nuclease-like domain-containing protein n=1 Tax=Fusarium mangiferae TaxID=192010 RepID=A0A1L7UDX1_FUSMA|nr:uncharacterized protein FMAN_14119 [Fusarium mangiferae]CVL08888.1 uncharacterized protein FMAN_14119 [Fusarium mangiferae]
MSSYASQLSDYIDGWLSTFIDDKISGRKGGAPILNWNDMPTPPSSDPAKSTPTRSRRRSPKRPRQDVSTIDADAYNIQGNPFDDQTPTGPSRALQMSIPSRPFSNPPTLPPSSSASGASNYSRSSSPVKRSTLELLQKPVRFIPMKKSHLPKHIHKTYDTIFSTAHGNNFIPNAVREDLKDSDEDILPQWFFEHPASKTPEYNNELVALREIQDAAISRQTQSASESAWNIDVHGPLLKLALKPFPSLKREIITHANISKPFVPEVRTDSYYNMTKSKMIDWGVTVSPSEATAKHISKIVDNLPHNKRSINQTIYGPVKNHPIAVSIEVKLASGSLEEARGQLGLWIAAWHRRMSLLGKSEEEIITVPLVMVMEHEWKLMFAVDRGDAIDIVEDIRMGDTRDLPGLYRIIAVLRELAIWMETDYLAWLDRWLGLAPPLDTAAES